MKILAVSPSPAVCAQSLDDERLRRLTYGTAVLLSSAMHLEGFQGPLAPPYRLAKSEDPATLWTASGREAYDWTLQLFQEMLKEYEWRFGESHKSGQHLETFQEFLKLGLLPQEPMPKRPLCTMGKFFGGNVYRQHRCFLKLKWSHESDVVSWTRRGHPDWR